MKSVYSSWSNILIAHIKRDMLTNSRSLIDLISIVGFMILIIILFPLGLGPIQEKLNKQKQHVEEFQKIRNEIQEMKRLNSELENKNNLDISVRPTACPISAKNSSASASARSPPIMALLAPRERSNPFLERGL